MVFNNEIRVQYEITRRTRFLSISSSIRRNIRSHDKKENEKRDTTDHRNQIDIKKRYSRKLRIKILKRIMNISGRQEQKKEQIILKVES